MSSKRNKNKTQKPKVCSVLGQRSQTSYKSHSVCITQSLYPASSRDFTRNENICNGNIFVLLEMQPHATGPIYCSIFLPQSVLTRL